MALRTIHHIAGQSNCVGNASKVALTDLRYDVSDASIQNIYKANGDAVIGPQAMTIPSIYFSVDAPIGHRRKAAGEAAPIVMRHGFSGTDLAVSWRPRVSSGSYVTYMATWHERLNHMLTSAFPGDTFEHRSWTWVQGETDAEDATGAKAAAYEANLRMLVETIRDDLAPALPIFLVRLSAAYHAGVIDPANLALVRNAVDAVAADTARVYSVSADDVELQDDDIHYTANGLMALGDLVADAMAVDGLANVTQYPHSARVFSALASAQAYSATAQTALGARSEDPAGSGFGTRGVSARDPWPTTARSAIKKHPYRNEWAVMVDSAMQGEGSLDTLTNIRALDAQWWGYV